jgi:hypothetical protein
VSALSICVDATDGLTVDLSPRRGYRLAARARRLSLLLAIRRLEKEESIVSPGEDKCALRMDYFFARNRLRSSASARRLHVEWPLQAARPQQLRISGSQRLSYFWRQLDFDVPVDLCTTDHGWPLRNKAHGSCYPTHVKTRSGDSDDPSATLTAGRP